MRVAALYDVHGNVAALEAVLADVPADALVLVGGDVAAGGMPSETVERLRGLGDRVRWIRGNADRELREPDAGPVPADVIEFVAGRLSGEQLDFLHGLPPQLVLDVDGLGPTRFCHATPRDDVEIRTAISTDERWGEVLEGVAERTVVLGHTHVQFDRVVGGIRVVNAGSVGMPYEDEPGAFWALLGPGVELRRTAYDVDAAVAAIAAAGFPNPWPRTSRAEATEHFERLSTQT